MAFLLNTKLYSAPPAQEYFEIRTYHLANKDQEKRMDSYLKDALLPGLHRAGISKVGVFKPVGNDTSSSLKIYLLIPYHSLNEMDGIIKKLEKDKVYQTAGTDYIDAEHNNAPYQRFEKTLLRAFINSPVLQIPAITVARSQRVYELRSYESPTEKRYQKKVKMFNDGDEIGLFARLGFNAIFYGDVISGSAMPNLMYMTSFESKESREEHWKAFFGDPQWKKLSALPEYANIVSKSETFFLFPTEYSDI